MVAKEEGLAGPDQATASGPVAEQRLSRRRMLLWLDELEARAGPAVTLYLPAGVSPAEAEGMWRQAVGDDPPDRLAREVERSPHGAAVLWAPGGGWLVAPPFPLHQRLAHPALDVGPLRALLQHDYTTALVLVRLGSYAAGVYQGLLAQAADAGTGNVHARHRNGGWSQARFDRHRLKQMETFFTRVCEHTQELLRPFQGQLDFIAYGGERQTLLAFRKQCDFLQRLDGKALAPLVPVGEPRRAALPEAIRQLWMSRVSPIGVAREPQAPRYEDSDL
jgi:hypothetical protein